MQTDFPHKVLAIDTSTDRMSVALGPAGAQALASHEAQGGANTSSTLIPAIQHLLQQVGWTLAELDAIVVGCGPGSFTGLRTACAVAQGLAVAARPGGVPVLALPTLQAVAMQAATQWREQQGEWPRATVLAVLDARMNEVYAARYAVAPSAQAPGWTCEPLAWSPDVPDAMQLCSPETCPPTNALPIDLLAGNAHTVYAERLPAQWHTTPTVLAWPTATALLRLAGPAWVRGQAVEAARAQPLYVRNKVAQTTHEREHAKRCAAAASATGV